jgi:hypothetical protein
MPKRPLAPLVLEQWCTVAGFGVIVLAASGLATQTDQPSFGVLDGALIAAVAVLMAWWLRRQRRDKIGVARFDRRLRRRSGHADSLGGRDVDICVAHA